MENQGTRGNPTNRPDPTTPSGFAGTGTSSQFGGAGRTAPTGGAAPYASTDAGRTIADAMSEQAGIRSQPGVVEGQGQSGGGGATTRMDAGIEKAAGGMDKLVGAIRDRGSQMEGQAGTSGTVGSVATTAADKLEGASQYLHQSDTERMMNDLESLIRRKPAESLLVAAGIGFVLAKAFK